jgi:cell division protein FtsX
MCLLVKIFNFLPNVFILRPFLRLHFLFLGMLIAMFQHLIAEAFHNLVCLFALSGFDRLTIVS